MSAKIIELKRYRSSMRNRHNGIVFPQLYRLTGTYYDEVKDGDNVVGLIPGNQPAGPYYTLSDEDDAGICNTRFEAITGFTPGIDSGWLIIRHHMRPEFLEGYLDGYFDLAKRMDDGSRLAYRTEKGLFTIARRPPHEGKPDHLVVYVTKIPVPTFDSPMGVIDVGGWMNSVQIVHPDGSITEDEDFLFYDERDED